MWTISIVRWKEKNSYETWVIITLFKCVLYNIYIYTYIHIIIITHATIITTTIIIIIIIILETLETKLKLMMSVLESWFFTLCKTITCQEEYVMNLLWITDSLQIWNLLFQMAS